MPAARRALAQFSGDEAACSALLAAEGPERVIGGCSAFTLLVRVTVNTGGAASMSAVNIGCRIPRTNTLDSRSD